MMKTHTTNQDKHQRAHAALEELLLRAMQRGFYGTVAVELNVQDGTVQYIRRRVEQLEK